MVRYGSQGKTRLGLARHGAARRDTAVMAWLGKAWQGAARRGKVWQSRLGKARLGAARPALVRQSRQVPVLRGKSRHVMACTGRLIAYFNKQGGLQWFINGKAVPE